MLASVSARLSASSGLFAWIVVSEPSWPVFIAESMSMVSPPRTSPTMMRSGRMRSALRTRSRIVTDPLPSTLGGRDSRRMTCDCWSESSAASSMVTMRSRSGMNDDSELSSVVLPEPVPPETRTLRRARTQAASRSAARWSRVPTPTSSSIVKGRGNLRIVTTGPSSARGGRITLTRSPVRRRASTMGLDSSTRRLTVDTMRSMVWSSCSVLTNRSLASSMRPSRSMKIWSGPFTMISVTASSARSGSSTPRPRASATTRRMSAVRSRLDSSGPREATRCVITRSSRARRCGRSSLDSSLRSISSSSFSRKSATITSSASSVMSVTVRSTSDPLETDVAPKVWRFTASRSRA